MLRFSLVDTIRDLVATDERAAAEYARLQHPEWLLLAALILDTAGEDAEPVDLARRLAGRLDLGAAAEQEIALLVGDSSLLRAAAQRVDGFDEERVFALATHLDRPERARALYLLTLALGGLEPWDRSRLDELHDLVLARSSSPTSRASTPATSSSGGAPKRSASPAMTGPSPNASRMRRARTFSPRTRPTSPVRRRCSRRFRPRDVPASRLQQLRRTASGGSRSRRATAPGCWRPCRVCCRTPG